MKYIIKCDNLDELLFDKCFDIIRSYSNELKKIGKYNGMVFTQNKSNGRIEYFFYKTKTFYVIEIRIVNK